MINTMIITHLGNSFRTTMRMLRTFARFKIGVPLAVNITCIRSR